MCVEGSATFDVQGDLTELSKGQTVLIPASLKSFSISTNHAKLLEVYI
jgi:mannose-6-phosphate isomerase